MCLHVKLLLVLEQSSKDIESLGEVAHQVVDNCYIVAQLKLGEVILAGEYFSLEVLDE